MVKLKNTRAFTEKIKIKKKKIPNMKQENNV